jgi:uncharacterized Fe-S cluster-containing radical SAM superfamily protein
MNINLDQALVEVNSSKFLRMEHAAGVSFSCVSGSLWITKDHCTKDFELLPGDTYVADTRQSVTVCGFEPSIVRVFQLQENKSKRSSAWNSTLYAARSFLAHAFAGLHALTH